MREEDTTINAEIAELAEQIFLCGLCVFCVVREFVSGEQSSVGLAVKDWLLGTQAAPACEAGALARDRLMTAGRSR